MRIKLVIFKDLTIIIFYAINILMKNAFPKIIIGTIIGVLVWLVITILGSLFSKEPYALVETSYSPSHAMTVALQEKKSLSFSAVVEGLGLSDLLSVDKLTLDALTGSLSDNDSIKLFFMDLLCEYTTKIKIVNPGKSRIKNVIIKSKGGMIYDYVGPFDDYHFVHSEKPIKLEYIDGKSSLDIYLKSFRNGPSIDDIKITSDDGPIKVKNPPIKVKINPYGFLSIWYLVAFMFIYFLVAFFQDIQDWLKRVISAAREKP